MAPHASNLRAKLVTMFSLLILVLIGEEYVSFLLQVGDRYPDMVWDEIQNGLIGLAMFLIWLTIDKALRHKVR